MKALVIVNPRAGIARDRQKIARQVEGALPDYEVEIATPGSIAGLRETVTGAVSQGTALVIAVGGDGTVHEVGRHLIGTRTALGILPLGSGNGLARGLGIGFTAKQALDVLRDGGERTIDVGYVNDEPFFSVSGIGFDAAVGEGFAKSKVRGILPYLSIAARESIQFKPVEVSIRFGGREIVAKVLLVAVANTDEFGSGARIAPNADPSDGLLDVVVIRNVNVLEMLVNSPRLFDGSIQEAGPVEMYQASEIRILRPQSAPLHVDGEPLEQGPVLHYRVARGALRVRVPSAP